MPHQLEAAKTGRSKCRACKQSIEKADVRLGEAVPNPFGEGEATHWYHWVCGARRRPEAFLSALEENAEVASGFDKEQVSALRHAATKAVTFYRLCRFVRAEKASSGRARCQGCRQLIEKGALRFVLERIEDGMVSGAGFVHVGCAHKYAGSVDGVLERVEAQSQLSEEEGAQMRAALLSQAALEEVIIERYVSPQEGDAESGAEGESGAEADSES